MGKPKKYGINTRALHTKKRIELPTGDVMSPLHLTSTYENPVPGESEYFYGRVNNPTREIFERTMPLAYGQPGGAARAREGGGGGDEIGRAHV